MDAGQDIEIKSSSKVFWRAFPVSERKDLEPSALFSEKDSPDPSLRRPSAFVSSTSGPSEPIPCHVFPAKPSGTSIAFCSTESESKGGESEAYRPGVQQRSRGLLHPVDNPLGPAGFEDHDTSTGYFRSDFGDRETRAIFGNTSRINGHADVRAPD